MDTTKKHLFVIENPLLDISVEVKEDAIIKKYELIPGGVLLASEKQMPMYEELWGMEGVKTIPGGSGLNSARGANFMLKNQGHADSVVYFGSIADDKAG